MPRRARLVVGIACAIVAAVVPLACQALPGFRIDKDDPDGADAESREAADADATVIAADARDAADGGAADAIPDAIEDAGIDPRIIDSGGTTWDGAIVCEAPDAAPDAAASTRFCAIYRDMFSPVGSAQCQSAGCHGGDHGADLVSMGWTGKECYDLLTKQEVWWLNPHRLVEPLADGGDSRPRSLLPIIVNPNADAGFFMPAIRIDDANRILNPAERARLDAWLARGAPFD